jgi:putative flippase GtrA
MHVWRADAPLFTRVADMMRHPTGKKLIKYSAVSIISTTVSQVTLLMVFGVFHWLSPVPANIVANAVATIPSYTLNRRWVWGKGGRSHVLREVVPFWVLSFVGLALSSVMVYGAGQFAKHHGLHHFGTAVLVNAANLFAFGALWILKFIIFNKLFHIEPIEFTEGEADLVEA